MKIKHLLLLSIYLCIPISLFCQTNYKIPINGLYGYILMLLLFLAGLIIGGIAVYLFSKWSIYSILSNEKYKYFDDLNKTHEKHIFKYIGFFYILKKSKDEKKAEIAQLNKEISKLNKELNIQKHEHKTKIATKTDTIQIINENNVIEPIEIEKEKVVNNVIEWEIEPENQSPNIIYFTIPEADGYFKSINGKHTKELDCFYKIEIDKNNQKGKLYFISSDYDLKAIDGIDYYLNPVCEIENITDRAHTKKILLLKHGIVIFNGDNWKIDTNNKVKIKLI